MGKENKVQFNLKNVHYAILEDAATPTYGTPVKVPGAVTLTLDASGDVTPFYADGIIYYSSVANNGYSGALEMARFTDQMMQDIWKMEIGKTDKVLIENSNVEPSSFALLYQIDGDAGNQMYCLYNCTAARPGIGSTTNSDSKEPQTQSASVTAAPLENGNVLARTTGETPDETRNGWFTQVYVRNGE